MTDFIFRTRKPRVNVRNAFLSLVSSQQPLSQQNLFQWQGLNDDLSGDFFIIYHDVRKDKDTLARALRFDRMMKRTDDLYHCNFIYVRFRIYLCK